MPVRFTPALDAVVFDMDGVLTDTARLHERAWAEHLGPVLQGAAGPPHRLTAQDYRQHLDGRDRMEGLGDLLRSRGIKLPVGTAADRADAPTQHALAARKDASYLRLLDEERPVVHQATVDLVVRLQEAGYGTALVTASRNASHVLRMVGLERLFPVQVDGMVAARLGLPGKPAPDMFLEAARRLGVAPARTAVVEDARAGVTAARRGGFGTVIGLAGPPEDQALRDAGADPVVPRLDQAVVEPRPCGRPSALDHVDALLARAAGHGLAVFLDYDGTLTPIVDRPEQALLPAEARAVLEGLVRHVPVAVVSGRDREDVARRVGVEGVHCAGSHGLDLVAPDGTRMAEADAALPALDAAERVLRERLTDVPGALVERKRFSVAAHHRLVARKDVPRVTAAMDEALAAAPGLRRGTGKQVLEARPDVDWDKGRAVAWLLEAWGQGQRMPVFVGDDVTDEDAFAAVWGRGVGVLVAERPRPTRAEFALRDPDEVLRFLGQLLRRLDGMARGAA